jgi:hypothetical protein
MCTHASHVHTQSRAWLRGSAARGKWSSCGVCGRSGWNALVFAQREPRSIGGTGGTAPTVGIE